MEFLDMVNIYHYTKRRIYSNQLSLHSGSYKVSYPVEIGGSLPGQPGRELRGLRNEISGSRDGENEDDCLLR
jgi:hypothetical protein